MATLTELANLANALNMNVKKFRAEVTELRKLIEQAGEDMAALREEVAEQNNNYTTMREHVAQLTEIACSNKPAPYIQANLATFTPGAQHEQQQHKHKHG